MPFDTGALQSSSRRTPSAVLRVFVLAIGILVTWSLIAAALPGALGVPPAAAQSESGEAPALNETPPLPVIVDADLDGWIDTAEIGLGSDEADPGSTPETLSSPLTCWDGIDNDLDGLIDDLDPGCAPAVLYRDAFPPAGTDTFESTIDLQGYELATLLGVCAVDFSGTGPVVVERSQPTDGPRTFETEIVSMQLTGTGSLLPGSPCNLGDTPTSFEATLIEDPGKASMGMVSSLDAAGAADFPADSFFDIHFQVNTPIGLLQGGPPGGPSGDPVQVTNTVTTMPPYHSPANADGNPECYAVDRAAHVHCPKPPLEHFLCYQGSFENPGESVVQLSDQFGQSRSTVNDADRLCVAVSKNSVAIGDEGANLERFRFAAGEEANVPQRVLVNNQFGPQELAVGQPMGLLVPSKLDGGPPAVALDHFKCYGVEGEALGRAVTLTDQHSGGEVRNGTVRSPITLCNPTTKTHNGIVSPVADPQWHLVCYVIETDATGSVGTFVENQFGEGSASIETPQELCVPSMKRIIEPDIEEPPPKRHANLPGTALYWKIGGYKGYPKSFDVPFVLKPNNKNWTYDKLDFRKTQKNRLAASGPGWAAYRDADKSFDELTVLFMNDSSEIVGVIVTGPGKLLPGNKQLARILAVTGPSLLESLQGAADHKMPPGLVKALGLKGTFGVYYGEYGFKNKAKAKQEMGDFFVRLEDPGE